MHDQCVILTETPLEQQIKINEYCRARGIYFLAADVRGLFCWSFTDVGDSFDVLDKNGEDPPEVMIESITKVCLFFVVNIIIVLLFLSFFLLNY